LASSTKVPPVTGPAQKARRGPKNREATLADHHQIAALESRFGLAAKSCEEWTHLHLSNPLHLGRNGGWPIGWVIEDEDQQIVGSMGNIPRSYEFEGRKILAVAASLLERRPWCPALFDASASV